MNEVAQSCPTLCDPMGSSLHQVLRLWDFLGKSTGVGCHSLLQNHHMTQKSHSYAYTLRKSKLKKIHVPQSSLQHCLQQGMEATQMSIDK